VDDLVMTYLVDCYLPGHDPTTAASLDRRLREEVTALRSGGAVVDWRGSLVIAEEATFSFFLACTDVQIIETLFHRLSLAFDRIVPVQLVAPDSPP
jgi:hypothetical protein